MVSMNYKIERKLKYPLEVSPEDLEAFERDVALPGIAEALRRAGLVKVQEAGYV